MYLITVNPGMGKGKEKKDSKASSSGSSSTVARLQGVLSGSQDSRGGIQGKGEWQPPADRGLYSA